MKHLIPPAKLLRIPILIISWITLFVSWGVSILLTGHQPLSWLFFISYVVMFTAVLGIWITADSRKTLIWALLFVPLFHAPMLWQKPNDDMHRYVWEGKIQNSGFNPYIYAPNALELGHLRSGTWSLINHPDVPTIYQPFSLLTFRFLSAMGANEFGFKLFFFVLILATTGLLVILCQTLAIPVRHAILFGLNPLLLVTVSGQGHVEIIMVFWLVAALLAWSRRFSYLLIFCLFMAGMSKLTAFMFIPFFLNRQTMKALWTGAIPLLLFVPYIDGWQNILHVPLMFAGEFHFNGPLYSLIIPMMSYPSAAIICWSIFFIGSTMFFFIISDPLRSSMYVGTLFIFCTTTLHPWYLLMLLPFIVLFKNPALLVLQVSIGAALLVDAYHAVSGIYALPVRVTALEFIPPILAGVIQFWRRRSSGLKSFSEPQSISIIIPVLNEEQNLKKCLASITVQTIDVPVEIIVVDGGSTDQTSAIARQTRWARLLSSNRGRGVQINAGAASAAGDLIVVLHADTTLAKGALAEVLRSMVKNPCAVGGCCTARYLSNSARFRLIGWMNNIRARFFGIGFGDQVQFYRRTALKNGFPDYYLMEDIELSFRQREVGPSLVSRALVFSSPRRWQTHSYIKNFTQVIWLSLLFIIKRRFGFIRDRAYSFYVRYYGKPA